MTDQSPSALREAGLARLKTGDLQQAADLLGRAALAEPNDPAAQLGLGVALQRAGSHAEALAAFARARALLPGDAAPPLHAAFSLLALGRSEAALQAAEAACAAAPNLAEAHVMQGRALLALERHADAARAIAAALRLAPQSAETWTLAAAAKRRAGDPAGAMAALQEALRLRPDLAAARKELAELERAAARDSDKLNAWRPTSQAAALGLAVEYLSRMPAFAALPFGEWSQVLFHQVAREHYLFVVDGEQKMRGFLGWTLVDREFAEDLGQGPQRARQRGIRRRLRHHQRLGRRHRRSEPLPAQGRRETVRRSAGRLFQAPLPRRPRAADAAHGPGPPPRSVAARLRPVNHKIRPGIYRIG